jgi:hypothetical protein
MESYPLPAGYTWKFGRGFDENDKAIKTMAQNMLLAVVLIFLVMASLFESALYPLSIITSIIFAIVGSIWFLTLTGTTITMMAMIGFMVLMGVVVNIGIVLIAHVIDLRHSGLPRHQAILQAGKHVYSEKPLTLSLADGLALRDLAAARGLRLGCAPDTFLGGAHQQARALIDEGRIGTITAGSSAVMNHGMEGWHPNPDFFFLPGGGPMLDLGPYYIANLINLIGPVRRVGALTSSASTTRMITSQPRRGQSPRQIGPLRHLRTRPAGAGGRHHGRAQPHDAKRLHRQSCQLDQIPEMPGRARRKQQGRQHAPLPQRIPRVLWKTCHSPCHINRHPHQRHPRRH